ncbi:GGDEF domain-containing protein [Oleispirillum naphthae]|uniref:sensor domain-containing diguanylate cyclase n=1 Tax=Oleispirillum naphthae TaxID=2838853 RepID=UPI003082362D
MYGAADLHGFDGLLLQVLDDEGCILDVNPEWNSLLEYAAEDCVGLPFRDFLEPGLRAEADVFFRALGRPGASPFLPVALRGKSGRSVGGILMAQPRPREAGGGYACEIWTTDGFARAVSHARTRAERDRATDTVTRAFSAVTELLAKSNHVPEFLRDLTLLMEAISGAVRVVIEPQPPEPPAPWLAALAAEMRRGGRGRETGAAAIRAGRLAEIAPELAAAHPGLSVLLLCFADETMPAGRRHAVMVLPDDAALAEAWEKQSIPYACAVANALSCLTLWERQSEMLRKAHTLSVTDPLTQVFNRYKLEEVLASEERRARRYGTGFSVIMADIDRFKAVNDTFGHPIGDRVLEIVAAEMRASTRTTDVVGRWGGEEFLIVCVHTRPEAAVILADMLRRRIAAIAFPEAGRVTVSFGVSAHAPGDSAAAVVSRADAALYAAKRGGRNRVCVEAAPSAETTAS